MKNDTFETLLLILGGGLFLWLITRNPVQATDSAADPTLEEVSTITDQGAPEQQPNP